MSPRLSPSELFLRAQTDERLAALAAEGHGRAFAILVERHRSRLHAHARRIVGGHRGEDVVQQALLRAWLALSGGDEIRHVAAWLHRIVHNVALSELTRSLAGSEPLDEELRDPVSIEHTAERRLEVRALLAGLAGLPERQRLALLGTEIEGRSRRQLAAELGLSEGAVRQLVHRARAGVRASVAAVVPWPLVLRGMRASGWFDAGDAPWHPGGDAATTATLTGGAVAGGAAAGGAVAGGAAAGGAVKAGTALLIVGAIGGGIALRDGRGHTPLHRGAVPGGLTSTIARTRLPDPLIASTGAARAGGPTKVLAVSVRVAPARPRLAGATAVARASSSVSGAGAARPGSDGDSPGEASRAWGQSGGSRPRSGDGGDSLAGYGGQRTDPSDGSAGPEKSAGPSSGASTGDGGDSARSVATAPTAAATTSTDGERQPTTTVSTMSTGSEMAADTFDRRDSSGG